MGGGGAVQFVCSNYNLLCSPHVPYELSVAVQIPLTLSHRPTAHCTLQKTIWLNFELKKRCMHICTAALGSPLNTQC